jgi:hypothetical protein
MLIVLMQQRQKMVGILTTTRLINEETGEILATDLTVKQGDPVRIARQAINAMLAEYPGALVYADERLINGISCKLKN